MSRKGKWSGRLTPRHLRRRLSRHAYAFAAGHDERWGLRRLTAGERMAVARSAESWAKFFEAAGRTWAHVRALRAAYNQYGLVCEEQEYQCRHGACQVCHSPVGEVFLGRDYPLALDAVCE